MSAAPVLTPLPRVARDEFDSENRYEIIDGRRVEIAPMSADSQVLASRLVRLLSNYGIDNNVGEACMEVTFKLPLTRDRNRRPDAAFVPYTVWPKNRPVPSVNAWDVLPSVCVEVVSPHDVMDEIWDKIVEYFEAGVRQVWVIFPRHGLLYVYDSLTEAHGWTRSDELEGGPVLPGFRFKLSELFPDSRAHND